MTETLPFEDHFDAPVLDTDVWIPHYLPQWSSRAESAAAYTLADSCLRLYLPEDHPLWCPEDHPPLRVSGIRSGVFSGPAGSTVGQQPVRPGAVVREEQPAHRGWTPRYGVLELRARATLTPRSMVAWWLVGLEDRPERCAELCVMEVFGDAVDPGRSAAVGMGAHACRRAADPHDRRHSRLPDADHAGRLRLPGEGRPRGVVRSARARRRPDRGNAERLTDRSREHRLLPGGPRRPPAGLPRPGVPPRRTARRMSIATGPRRDPRESQP